MRHLWLEGGMRSKRIPIPRFPTFLEENPTKTQEHPIKSQEEQSQDEVTSCFKKYLALEDKAHAIAPFREYCIYKYKIWPIDSVDYSSSKITLIQYGTIVINLWF